MPADAIVAPADTSQVDRFHQSTKWGRQLPPQLADRITSYLTSPALRRLVAADRKQFDGCASVALPDAALGNISLQQVLAGRRSLASHQAEPQSPASLEDLSAILKYSYGITGEMTLPPAFPRQPLRAAPSAGALYPLEIYPVVMRVAGLPAGIYHYDVFRHALTELRREETRQSMPGLDLQPVFREVASVVFVITAMVRHPVGKYLERGYRFMHNDCGALLQNLYLTSTARGLAGCALGGFNDDALGSYLGIDNRQEIVLLGYVMGGRP